MGDLINEILTRLRLIVDFQFVAIWNNQFEYLQDGGEYVFPMPCVFVEVQNENNQDLGCNYQGQDINIIFHIGQDFYNGSQMEQNFTIFELRDLLVKSISNFKPTTASKMVKTSELQDFNHSNVYHYAISYKTHWIDNTAVNEETLSTAPLNLIINK